MSWREHTILPPFSTWTCLRNARVFCAHDASRLATGSSARSRVGALRRALQIAKRWRSPRERVDAHCVVFSPRPNLFNRWWHLSFSSLGKPNKVVNSPCRPREPLRALVHTEAPLVSWRSWYMTPTCVFLSEGREREPSVGAWIEPVKKAGWFSPHRKDRLLR